MFRKTILIFLRIKSTLNRYAGSCRLILIKNLNIQVEGKQQTLHELANHRHFQNAESYFQLKTLICCT